MPEQGSDKETNDAECLEVAGEIRAQAARCGKKQCCLERGESEVCRVTECISDQVFFVKKRGSQPCAYAETFGDGSFCTCPVRKELYRKYRI